MQYHGIDSILNFIIMSEQDGTTKPPAGSTEYPDLRWLRGNDEPFRQIIDLHWEIESGERKIHGATIDDPLYGTFEFDYQAPGDALLIDLFFDDAFNRLALIEQLTLPEHFATKPEAANYSVYEHSLGCALLTRRLGGTPEQQIRAAIHDIAKKAFAHLDDWRKQGMGGPEDHHESAIGSYLQYWGLDKMFESHGFSTEDLIKKHLPDFVENDSPDLCVDRVDYALREYARWTCPDDVPWLIEQLEVKNDMIVFRTIEAARVFAYSYQELYWQHWAEEEHAVKEKLLIILIEHGIETGVISEDDMATIDPVVLAKLEMSGDEVIHNLLWLLARPRLDITMNRGFAGTFPKDNFASQKDKLFVPIRDFKRRWVNPSFLREDGSVDKLSDEDKEFERHLAVITELKTSEQWEEFGRREGINEEWCQFAELTVDPELKQTVSRTGKLF